MTKHTILFLAANPLGTDRLALDEEARAIQEELERSGHRDQFELVTRWAVRPLDLLRELRKVKPTIVHFSGHGGGGEHGHRSDPEPRRDIDSPPSTGLFFQGRGGWPQLVTTDALRETFGAAGSSVKVVVLNACYSDAQAEVLLAHVDCVVGMDGAIGDAAARAFAIGFYGGLGEQQSVASAYKQGCAAIRLEGLLGGAKPQLKIAKGTDAEHLILPTQIPAGRARGVVRYLIYVSAVKLDMLANQLSPQESDGTALSAVVSELRRQGLIGTTENPGEYFEGELPMRWGPVGFYHSRCPESDDAGYAALAEIGDMVLFKGTSNIDSIIAMVGSSRHMIGNLGVSPARSVAYTNPAFWAKIAAGTSAPPDEVDNNRYGMHFGLRRQRTEAPEVNVAFVAKTFMRSDGLLLGSPLFVALR